jgi:hypothetical protein
VKKLTFYAVFGLLFCIGGLLAFTGIIPFRMVYVSPLPFLLIPFFGVPVDRVAQLFLLLVIVILTSGAINGSSPMDIVLFSRFVITPLGMFYLAKTFLTRRNVKRVLSISMAVGMIQLPIVIVQRLLYDQLIQFASIPIARVDFNVGTFYVKDDPALSFFLIGLVLFLLFDDKNNYFVRHRYLKAMWLSVTVLLANSILSHLLIVGLWAYFVLRQFSLKTLVRVSFGAVAVIAVVQNLGYSQSWVSNVQPVLQQVTFSRTSDEATFREGSYARSAAVLYYLRQPLKVWGDGPSKYYDPVTKRYVLGNRGQIFTFYAEIGMVGLLVGYLILLAMARKTRRASRRIALPLFFCVSALTITTSVMSDASIMLAYSIFLNTNLASSWRSMRAERATDDALLSAPRPLEATA